MDFCKVKQELNRKLIKIWSYRKYTSNEERNADEISRKIYFIQKIESKAVLVEEKYTAWRRVYARKHVELQQKERLMRRCRNLELRIRLDEEIKHMEKNLEKILKKIFLTFNKYCAYREQIIEFKGRHYDLYEIHCKYYEEVIILFCLILFILFKLFFCSIIPPAL